MINSDTLFWARNQNKPFKCLPDISRWINGNQSQCGCLATGEFVLAFALVSAVAGRRYQSPGRNSGRVGRLQHISSLSKVNWAHNHIIEMELLGQALMGQGFSNTNFGGQGDRLRELILQCTYQDDTKHMIQKNVVYFLQAFPYFKAEILEFAEDKQIKRFLELKSILEVDVRGKTCKVDFNMMLPGTFPHRPPFVRIISRNQEYIVDPFYKQLRSPTDPMSFILNPKIQSIRQWNHTSSLSNVVLECRSLLRQHFPFNKPSQKSGSSTMNSGWASLNQQSAWGNQPQTQNNMYNNFGYNNQGYSQGYNGQPMGQGFSQGANQGFSQGNMYPQPPIPFNNKGLSEMIASGQKHAGESKKIVQKFKSEHLRAVEKIQHLETINSSIASELEYLQGENSKITEFLKRSENSQMPDLSSLIRPRDERSSQVLELASSIKARDDCILLLEDKFSNTQLTFEELLKMVRKLEEEKFDDKALLLKCLTA